MNKLQQHICKIILRNIQLQDSGRVSSCQRCQQTKQQLVQLQGQTQKLKIEEYRYQKKIEELQRKVRQKEQEVEKIAQQLKRTEKTYQESLRDTPRREPIFTQTLRKKNDELSEENELYRQQNSKMQQRLGELANQMMVMREKNTALEGKLALKEYEIDQWSSSIQEKFKQPENRREQIMKPKDYDEKLQRVLQITSEFRELKKNKKKGKQQMDLQASYNRLFECMTMIMSIVQS